MYLVLTRSIFLIKLSEKKRIKTAVVAPKTRLKGKPAAYTDIIPEAVIVPSLILWRFISYYFPMIIGGIIFNIVDNRSSIKCKEEAK